MTEAAIAGAYSPSSEGSLPRSRPTPASLLESITPDTTDVISGGDLVTFPARVNEIPVLEMTRGNLEAMNGHAQRETLLALRRRDFDPAYQRKFAEIFPESENQFPLSYFEIRVFEAAARRMTGDDTNIDEDRKAMDSLMPDSSFDKATPLFDAEAARRAEGGTLLIGDANIGSYKLAREIMWELDEQVSRERKRDDIKRLQLMDMERLLEQHGLGELDPADQATLDRLTEQEEEMRRFRREEVARRYH